MKTLYLIGGTMGVGKTSVGRELKKLLPGAVFLDGDWCWDMDPLVVTRETKAMVMANIRFLLTNFLRCSAIENIIFCWVMHEQQIIDEIRFGLELTGCRVVPISLTCTEAALRTRLRRDIDAGLRSENILERSIPRLPLYEHLNTWLLDTTGQSPRQVAEQIGRQ